jgi:cardiolipin synthase (CMP-forming)
VSLATIILGRDLSLALAAIYYRHTSLPPPKTLSRYWDFSLPSAQVHPTFVSKVNTSLQLVLVGTALTLPLLLPHTSPFGTSLPPLPIDPVYAAYISSAFLALKGVVAGTTLWSGASYAWRKDVVKILGEDEGLKARQGLRGRMVIGVSFAVVVGLAGWLFEREWRGEDGEEIYEAVE